MKLTNIKTVYLTAIVLFAGVVFSACSDSDRDYDYRIEGTIDFSIEPVTNPRDGYFEQRAYINDRHISDLNDNWIDPYYIYSWEPLYEENKITNMHIFSNYAYIDWFDIEVVGVGVYEYSGPRIELLGDDPFIIDEVAYQRLMQRASERIIRNGGVDIIVRGSTNIRNQSEPLYFDFFNSINFQLRK